MGLEVAKWTLTKIFYFVKYLHIMSIIWSPVIIRNYWLLLDVLEVYVLHRSVSTKNMEASEKVFNRASKLASVALT